MALLCLASIGGITKPNPSQQTFVDPAEPKPRGASRALSFPRSSGGGRKCGGG